MKRKMMPRSVEKFLFSGQGQMLVAFHRGGKLVDAIMFDSEDVMLLSGQSKIRCHNAVGLFDLKTPGGRAMRACIPSIQAGLERIRGYCPDLNLA